MLNFLVAAVITLSGVGTALANSSDTVQDSEKYFWEVDFETDPEPGKVYIITSSTPGDDGVCHVTIREDVHDPIESYEEELRSNEDPKTVRAIIFEPNSDEPRPLEWFYGTKYTCPLYESRQVPSLLTVVVIATDTQGVMIAEVTEVDSEQLDWLIAETKKHFVLTRPMYIDRDSVIAEAPSLAWTQARIEDGYDFLDMYIYRGDDIYFGVVLAIP